MTDDIQTPTPSPQAPNTAPPVDSPDGTFAPGVDDIGEGFEGSTVLKTVGDDNVSSIQPQDPLPENATETEKDVARRIEEAKDE